MEEPKSDDALRLLDDWGRGEIELIAPRLLPIEVANALNNYSRRGILSPEQCLDGIARLEDLSLAYVEESFGLIREAISLAPRLDVAIYDALYLCLASDRDALLITADRKLYAKAKKLGNVQLIGEE